MSTNQQEEDNPNSGIWQQILSESTTAENVSIDGRSIIVLGDRNCGKTSLLSSIKNQDLHKDAKGLAIDYTYFEVKEDGDVLTRINVWQLEGDRQHESLLKFALNSENIHKSIILITLDFSKPWDLIQSLNNWLEGISNHIKGLRLTSKILDPLKNKLIKHFHNYKEPEDGAKKQKRVIDLTSSNINNDDNNDTIPVLDDENALSHNLGIPIIVACCKTDIISTLERNFHYRDDEFEFIQQYLRKICLKYGASLIYTSTRENYNCDVLSDYIEHLLFNFDFVYQTQILAKQALFVPIGYDSSEKINIDFRNQQLTSDPNQVYEELITKPSSVLQQESIIPLIIAEDDQAFLERNKNAIDKQEHVKKKKEERDSSLQSPSSITSPNTPVDNSTQKEVFRQNFLEQMKKASPTSTSSTTPKTTPTKPLAKSGSINRDEMKSFFNNLLKKDKQ